MLTDLTNTLRHIFAKHLYSNILISSSWILNILNRLKNEKKNQINDDQDQSRETHQYNKNCKVQ